MSARATEPVLGLDLALDGTPESLWLRALAALPTRRPPVGRRVIVVGPHPDDETVGVGGIISMLVASRTPVVLLLLTDGEAASDEADLVERRQRELQRSLSVLGGGASIGVQRLQLPDSGLAMHADALEMALETLIGDGDVVLAPLENDGHGDHDAAGRAARIACEASGAELWLYPVWAWHWHQPETSPICERGVRIPLTREAIEIKRRALLCFESQFDGECPVVPADMLARFHRPFEVLVRR